MVIINILAIIIENLDFLEVKNQKKEMHIYYLLPGVSYNIFNNMKIGNNGPARVQKVYLYMFNVISKFILIVTTMKIALICKKYALSRT